MSDVTIAKQFSFATFSSSRHSLLLLKSSSLVSWIFILDELKLATGAYCCRVASREHKNSKAPLLRYITECQRSILVRTAYPFSVERMQDERLTSRQ